MSDRSIKNIVELKNSLAAGEAISDDISQWLLNAINELEKGTASTFDEGLNTQSAPGVAKIGVRLRLHLRNLYYVKLIESIDKSFNGKYKRCCIAGELILGFHRKFKRLKNKTDLQLTEQEKILSSLFSVSRSPASSPATLHRIYLDQKSIFHQPPMLLKKNS